MIIQANPYLGMDLRGGMDLPLTQVCVPRESSTTCTKQKVHVLKLKIVLNVPLKSHAMPL